MLSLACRIALRAFWACCAFSLLHGAMPALAQGRADTDVSRYVNPFIGTDGTGHTSPGATVPFGMVYPGPDNQNHGWDYTSGYQYKANTVLGFSNTRISGAGIPELGDILLQPRAGTRWSSATSDFRARMDKLSEQAQPGYYKVKLPDNGVTVELSATQRVAFQRYTFARPGRVQVLVDLQHGLIFDNGPNDGRQGQVTQSGSQVDAQAGEISGTRHTSNWVERETAFVVRFSQSFARVEQLPLPSGAKAPRYLLTFELKESRQLLARVALSTVDLAGARGNLDQAATTTFDQARTRARQEWNALLGRITIDASRQQKVIFYTALYHVLLHPSDIADADGRVRGPTGQVIQARDGRYYSTLSLWDTFRGVHPLLTLLTPERVNGFILTLLDHHKAMGYLPLWTAWGRETWTMIGNPALPVIADAVAKGFAGFSHAEALQAMVQTSTEPRPGAPAWAQRDWSDYLAHGYVPIDKISNEAVSQTLELGIGDDAVARVARSLGNPDVVRTFETRAQGFLRLYDTQTRMMRGRDSKGNWRIPFDPLTPTSPLNNPGDYTEANAWQYTLTPALHDPRGLIETMGGSKAFEEWLDQFFTVQAPGANKHLGQEALIGQYAHGNEPSHHIAYLYAYTDAPWKGHALIHDISQRFYSDRPDGITGNDDCGQMGAWYVLSTLGMYPVVPASGTFVLGAPQVRSANLQLPGNQALKIVALNYGTGRTHATRATLNGKATHLLAMRYQDLIQGGRLEFHMTRPPGVAKSIQRTVASP